MYCYLLVPTDEHYWQFGIVTACVCVPFFILVGSLNTTRGLHFWRHKVAIAVRDFFGWIFRRGRPRSTSDTDGYGQEDNKKAFDSPLPSRPTARPLPSIRPARKQARHTSVDSDHSQATSDFRGLGAERWPSITGQPSSQIASMIAGDVERRRTVTYGPEVSQGFP